MTKQSLSMDVRVGESVAIDGDRITLTVDEKSGQRARLRFEMDASVVVKKVVPAQTGASLARHGVRVNPG